MNIKLLDYGGGNVRSVRNAVKTLGYTIENVETAEDIINAGKLIFPGVGSFGSVMNSIHSRGYTDALIERIKENKPFLGICVALQSLFEGSEETPDVAGLGIIKGQVKRFPSTNLSVPQIGWNDIRIQKSSHIFHQYQGDKLYFVHSYNVPSDIEEQEWILTLTDYGVPFVSSVEKGNITATQFHPEKSGQAGLQIFKNFLSKSDEIIINSETKRKNVTKLGQRVIACLDVRSNDNGDLVVTKGDQYDVRNKGEVRNLGKPVELARRYYEEGADEVTFLNITGFRDFPLEDQPMIEVLQNTSENVFVPLTIGGGIRDFTDSNGKFSSALDVASEYFRSGADKISIGSDAVKIAEDFIKTGKKTGKSAIEQIAMIYGAQAVVISVDPRRVYVNSQEATSHDCIKTDTKGPNNEEYCWYQCTVQGGRQGCDVDVVQLVTACEALGAGEILLNCIDKDGTNDGFDLELINLVKDSVSIPVIASSGAGSANDFVEVFQKTKADAALAAGIFHRKEVDISEVKDALGNAGIEHR